MTAETTALRIKLRAATDRVLAAAGELERMQARLDDLATENASLRRTLDAVAAEARRLRRTTVDGPAPAPKQVQAGAHPGALRVHTELPRAMLALEVE